MQKMDLCGHTDVVNELLARYGVKFGIYKNNEFKRNLYTLPAGIWHNVKVWQRQGESTRILQELIWCREKTESGIFWRTICVFRQGRLIR